MRTRSILIMCAVLLATVAQFGSRTAMAHALLIRSEPAENEALAQSPAEIRLWFSEPLEPSFSRFDLLDSTGQVLSRSGTVDRTAPTDARQMAMLLPQALPDGVYSVSWQAVSTADGHVTRASFPFTINAAAQAQPSAPPSSIPLDGTLIRWINLISLALLVGSISFDRFVWVAAQPAHPDVVRMGERRIRSLMWVGWAAVGLSGAILLLMQTALVAGVPVWAAAASPVLRDIVSQTRFGSLWVMRLGLWILTGLLLLAARREEWLYLVCLGLAGAILLMQSLFSHASASVFPIVSVAGDWLHLAASMLWVGALIPFAAVIPLFYGTKHKRPQALGALVGAFSNMARIAVASLALTGIYSAWLQVGSVTALLYTAYGQALLLKLFLLIPLLLIAAINLTLTSRGLRQGKHIWSKRLRFLVGTELALTSGIMLLVGVMTSISPARSMLAIQSAANQPPPSSDVLYMRDVGATHVMIQVVPGFVGENKFKVSILQLDGTPITDVSRIRLRFMGASQASNDSELQITGTQPQDGVYSVSGANLSTAGEWTIRVNVQRPEQYDTVTDFRVTMSSAPKADVDDVPPIETTRILQAGIGLLGLSLVGALALRADQATRRRLWLIYCSVGAVSAALIVNSVLALRS